MRLSRVRVHVALNQGALDLQEGGRPSSLASARAVGQVVGLGTGEISKAASKYAAAVREARRNIEEQLEVQHTHTYKHTHTHARAMRKRVRSLGNGRDNAHTPSAFP